MKPLPWSSQFPLPSPLSPLPQSVRGGGGLRQDQLGTGIYMYTPALVRTDSVKHYVSTRTVVCRHMHMHIHIHTDIVYNMHIVHVPYIDAHTHTGETHVVVLNYSI